MGIHYNMKIWLIQNIITGYVLLSYDDENRGRIYMEDLNAAAARLGLKPQYMLTSVTLIKGTEKI